VELIDEKNGGRKSRGNVPLTILQKRKLKSAKKSNKY
jgi:hypothetical protein